MINGELIIDNFAGGGGASTGIEMATGVSVDIAINHDPEAIRMHKTNHPNTRHYCESVYDVDPVKACGGHPVGLVWLSPDCKHFSKAKGGTPVEKSIRGLAWIGVKWAALVRPRVIMLENVEEFKTWGPLRPKRDEKTGRILVKDFDANIEQSKRYKLRVAEPGESVPVELQVMEPDPERRGKTFRKFIKALEGLGYKVEFRELVAADYGAPTMRKRLCLIARCDGKPIVWPEPTHGPLNSQAVKEGLLQPYQGAYTQINFSRPCPSIFDTAEEIKEKYSIRAVRPLAPKTMERIARGIKKFVIDNAEPFIVQVNHSGSDWNYCKNMNEPLPVITSKHGFGIVEPYLVQCKFDNEAQDVKKPIGTLTTIGSHMLVAPTLIQYHNSSSGEARGQTVDKPIMTIDSSNRYGLVTSFLSKYYDGGYKGAGADIKNPLPTATAIDHNSLCAATLIQMNNHCDGRDILAPLPTITAGDGHFGEVRAFLIKYYGDVTGQDIMKPLDTVTTKDRFGLVTVNGVDYKIVDIGLRMLEPRELYGCQSFPDDYIIDHDYTGKQYPRSEQVARCGNSVPPKLSEALVRANLPEMCIRKRMPNMRIEAEETGQLRFA